MKTKKQLSWSGSPSGNPHWVHNIYTLGMQIDISSVCRVFSMLLLFREFWEADVDLLFGNPFIILSCFVILPFEVLAAKFLSQTVLILFGKQRVDFSSSLPHILIQLKQVKMPLAYFSAVLAGTCIISRILSIPCFALCCAEQEMAPVLRGLGNSGVQSNVWDSEWQGSFCSCRCHFKDLMLWIYYFFLKKKNKW